MSLNTQQAAWKALLSVMVTDGDLSNSDREQFLADCKKDIRLLRFCYSELVDRAETTEEEIAAKIDDVINPKVVEEPAEPVEPE